MRSGASVRRPARSRVRGFTDRGRALLVAGLLLAAAGFAFGFPDLARVGLFCLLVPVLARLMAWHRRPQLSVDRTLEPAPLVAGRPGRITLRLRNVGSRGCDALAAAEQVSPWLGSTARLVLPPLRAGETTSGAYDVRPARRGRHLAGPLRVVGRDPLGLTHVGAALGGALEVLVLPPIHDLTGADPTGLGMGHEGDAPSSGLAGTEHDVSVREYRQGDDLRRVHWGVTAHRGRLMVRHEAVPRLRRAVLLLDASAEAWGLAGAGRDATGTGIGTGIGTGVGPVRARLGAGAHRARAGGDRGRSSSWGDAASPEGRPAADAGFEWAIEALASVAAHLAALGFTLHLLVSGAAPDDGDRGDDPTRALLLDDVLTRLALVRPGGSAAPETGPGGADRAGRGDRGDRAGRGDRGGRKGRDAAGATGGHASGPSAGPLPTAAREVAGAGGLVVLVTGDRSRRSAHETFGVLHVGLAGLAVVVDTGAFERAAAERGDDADAPAGVAGSTVDSGAGLPGSPDPAPTPPVGADATRLCGYARSGGWRAVPAVPGMTPGDAWAQLLGSARPWDAVPVGATEQGYPR